jgi:hypothetical protein
MIFKKTIIIFIILICGMVILSGCTAIKPNQTDSTNYSEPLLETSRTSEPSERITEINITPESPLFFSGHGDDVVLFSTTGGLCIFNITNNGEDQFIVSIKESLGNYSSVLVNKTGTYSGKKSQVLERGEYIFDIISTGEWQINILTINSQAGGVSVSKTTPNIPLKILEFPDALPLNTRYQFEKPKSAETTSVVIKRVSSGTFYTAEKFKNVERVEAGAGNIFLNVIVDVYFDGNHGKQSPYPSNFTLISGGMNYTPLEISRPVLSLKPYTSVYMEGDDQVTGGSLLYKVPDTIILNQTYIELKFEDPEELFPVWKLG